MGRADELLNKIGEARQHPKPKGEVDVWVKELNREFNRVMPSGSRDQATATKVNLGCVSINITFDKGSPKSIRKSVKLVDKQITYFLEEIKKLKNSSGINQVADLLAKAKRLMENKMSKFKKALSGKGKLNENLKSSLEDLVRDFDMQEVVDTLAAVSLSMSKDFAELEKDAKEEGESPDIISDYKFQKDQWIGFSRKLKSLSRDASRLSMY